MNDQRVPNDAHAEQAVIGACMLRPDLIASVHLKPGDFYRPANEVIWTAILALSDSGEPADWVSVKGWLETRGQLARAGGWETLQEAAAQVLAPSQVNHWAARVRELSARRHLIDELLRNLQDAYESADPIEAIVGRAEDRVRSVQVAEPDFTSNLMAFDEFCDQEVPDDDWVIPGLMSRGDRLMLTGVEGLGKTMLQRQFAVCVAKGVHPFTFQPMQPRTVLVVDCENPKKIMVNSFRDLRASMRAKRGPIDEKRLWIERVPAGLNLCSQTDRLWLQRLAETVNPDLLCIGPVYKLYEAKNGDKDEDLARAVAKALDNVREAADCALIVEAHSPHGDGQNRDLRPIGSSLWRRWPEFGLGIRPADGFNRETNRLVDLVPWRGNRDERDWPAQLDKGTDFMPWMDAKFT